MSYFTGNPVGGEYAITEQGDLGLGLTPINEDVEDEEKKEDEKE